MGWEAASACCQRAVHQVAVTAEQLDRGHQRGAVVAPRQAVQRVYRQRHCVVLEYQRLYALLVIVDVRYFGAPTISLLCILKQLRLCFDLPTTPAAHTRSNSHFFDASIQLVVLVFFFSFLWCSQILFLHSPALRKCGGV